MGTLAFLRGFAAAVMLTLAFVLALAPPFLAMLGVSAFAITFLSDDVWGWINLAVTVFLACWLGQKLWLFSRTKSKQWKRDFDRRALEQLAKEHTEGMRDNTVRISHWSRKIEEEYRDGCAGDPPDFADVLRSARVALMLGPKYAMVEDFKTAIENERLNTLEKRD